MTKDAEYMARLAVKRIVRDLSDRRGLRHQWDSIDVEIRAEIEETWAQLIKETITNDPEP